MSSCYLEYISRWIKLDCCFADIELIAVQVEELHEDLTQVMFGYHSSRLHLRHVLQKTYNETDDRETTNAAVDGLIETPHGQKVLDKSGKYRHGGVLRFPVLECLIGHQTSRVLKRDIDLETCQSIDILDERNLGLEDHLNTVINSQLILPDEISEVLNTSPALAKQLSTSVHKFIGYTHKIHISCRQVQSSWEGPKTVDICVWIPLLDFVA